MKFYDIIADHYNALFPSSTEKLSFVKSRLPGPSRILDIGCATGELSIELAKLGNQVLGIDLNEAMIEVAAKAAETLSDRADFLVRDMQNLEGLGRFDVILCLGNTLSYLQPESIATFFTAARELLGENGVFIGQILNYERMSESAELHLPEKKSGGWILQRTYSIPDNQPDTVVFNTRLLNEETKIREEFQDTLTPFKKTDIEAVCSKEFSEVKFFGNYRGETYSSQAPGLIFEAKP